MPTSGERQRRKLVELAAKLVVKLAVMPVVKLVVERQSRETTQSGVERQRGSLWLCGGGALSSKIINTFSSRRNIKKRECG